MDFIVLSSIFPAGSLVFFRVFRVFRGLSLSIRDVILIAQHASTLDRLLSKAADGRRLSVDEALQLAGGASLADLGLAADIRRNQLHPGRRVSYIVERNINYTNVCNVYCRFCAFYRAPGRPGGYTLSKEELAAKIDETVAAGGIQILLQGGLNPELGIEYYEDLFRWLKRQYPAVNLHALSADEILHVGKVSSLSIEESAVAADRGRHGLAAGRRGGDPRRSRPQADRPAEVRRREVARRPPYGPSPGHPLHLHDDVRREGDLARSPLAPGNASPAPGRDRRFYGVHHLAVSAGRTEAGPRQHVGGRVSPRAGPRAALPRQHSPFAEFLGHARPVDRADRA